MLSFKYVALLVAAITSAGQAQACAITDLLKGDSQAATVTNHWDGSTYKTYLIRNSARDQHGKLSNFIKFELVPQRWGFDLELPSGKRFAQVNKESGKWIVSASPGFMDACADHYVTLRNDAAGKMEVYDGLDRIGAIERFPVDEPF